MKAMYGVFLLDTQTIWTPQAGQADLAIHQRIWPDSVNSRTPW